MLGAPVNLLPTILKQCWYEQQQRGWKHVKQKDIIVDIVLKEGVKNVIIYGASVQASVLVSHFRMKLPDVSVSVVVSNTEGENQHCGGIRVGNIRDYFDVSQSNLVVIAASSVYHEAMESMARQIGYKNIICMEDDLLHLVVCVGHACSLKCKECANFTPHVPYDSMIYNVDTICSELDAILGCCDVEMIQIQGGNPSCIKNCQN